MKTARFALSAIALGLMLTLAAPASGSAQTHTTVEGYAACILRSDFDDFTDILSSGDREAAAQFLQNSTCIILRSGVGVYRRNAKGLGVIQIRPAGQTVWLYTYMEAVREN